jgi:HAE1 family hydrophobic/amphiphilic exporter-1
MSISELFIRRPIMTTLVMMGILVFGVMAYRLLPVSDLPNVDFPTIQVQAALPGASPETMAAAVATPLEKQFTTIEGLDSMISNNIQGNTQITLTFSLNRSLDSAAQDVQSAIAAAARQLPQEMPTPPSYQKVNPAAQPILYLTLTSDTLPLSTIDEYGETMMAQRISTVSGVAQVQVYGAQKYAVRVQLDPQALASSGLGVEQVANAVQGANVDLPTGTLYGAHQAFTLQANGQLTDAAAYRPLIVTYKNGSPARLQDLGRVIDSVENDKTAAWFNNQRGVILAVQRQPGTNTVAVTDAIKKLLPSFRQQLPAAVNLNILFDRSESIRDSVADVKFTLLLTLFLVVLVIFLFLRNVSATVIPSLALPMSIVATFAVMYALDYSLDNLSLLAITLSVGFVVDDAIVVLENIVRHMECGESPWEAALRGSREIGFTVLSMTISLAAVFIPLLFMGGILGRLFREFAVTIGASVLVSGFVSLTLTPMLCSRFLRPPHEQRHGRFYQASERVFDRALGLYSADPGARLARRAGGHRLAVQPDPQGVHPGRGHRPDRRFHRGHPGDLLRVAGGPPAAALGDPRQGPERGRLHVLGRLARQQHRPQQRPLPDPPEAARPAAAGQGGDRGAAAQALGDPGHAGVPPDPAHHPHRRPAHQEPVPVHAPGVGHLRALSLRPLAGVEDAGLARPARRHLRPPDHQPAGAGGHRPRQGRRAGGEHAVDRGHPLLRLRLAPGVDHLRAQQPVPGNHGAGAAVSA